jgi:hypothetical protein
MSFLFQHTHQPLPQKIPSAESSGDNLRLLIIKTSRPTSFLPEPMVVEQPKFTRVEGESALLRNQVQLLQRCPIRRVSNLKSPNGIWKHVEMLS